MILEEVCELVVKEDTPFQIHGELELHHTLPYLLCRVRGVDFDERIFGFCVYGGIGIVGAEAVGVFIRGELY